MIMMTRPRKPPTDKLQNNFGDAPYALRWKKNNKLRWVLVLVTAYSLFAVYAWRSHLDKAEQQTEIVSVATDREKAASETEFVPLAYITEAQPEKTVPSQKLAPAVKGLTTTAETLAPVENKTESSDAKEVTTTAAVFEGVTLPKGREGLQEAVRLGLLRPAMDSDAQKWLSTHRQHFGMNSKDAKIEPHPFRYVILKEMRLPEGLYGAHSGVFFLPVGVPFPHGGLGHSSLYDMGNSTCLGAACGADF